MSFAVVIKRPDKIIIFIKLSLSILSIPEKLYVYPEFKIISKSKPRLFKPAETLWNSILVISSNHIWRIGFNINKKLLFIIKRWPDFAPSEHLIEFSSFELQKSLGITTFTPLSYLNNFVKISKYFPHILVGKPSPIEASKVLFPLNSKSIT